MPLLPQLIEYFNSNLDSLNYDNYSNYLYLIYTLNVKGFYVMKKDQMARMIERGRKLYEEIKESHDFVKLF